MAYGADIDFRRGSEVVAEELQLLRERIVKNMQEQNAVATGNTIRSLQVVAEPFGAKLMSFQRMPFGVLETGRKPGAVPGMNTQGVPVGFAAIIYKWMQAKGIHSDKVKKPKNPWIVATHSDQERADRSMAMAIAISIMNHGTKLFQMQGRDTIYSQEIPKTIDRIKERLSRFVSAEVVEQIELNTQVLNQ